MAQNSVTLYFNRRELGQPFNLDGVKVQLVRETQECVSPYHHFTVSFIAEPTANGKRTEAYLIHARALGDDWVSDLTNSDRLIDCMRAGSFADGQISHLLELAHRVRMGGQQ